jgi:hypothetical protein
MKTYWLIVTTASSPAIIPGLVRRLDGAKRDAEEARARYAQELGPEYLVTVETDKVARLYKSYRQFPGSDKEAY